MPATTSAGPGQRHIHVDPLGGIAGDMFAAACIDLYPELETGLRAWLCRTIPGRVSLDISRERSGGFRACRFAVCTQGAPHPPCTLDLFREFVARSVDVPRLREHALAIFEALIEAESRVHGRSIRDTHLHEAGDWDSVADILAASWLVDALGRPTWSVGSLPVGGGTVETAHGRIPIPAPATVELLRGLDVHDDGVGGERVTPTGAAILRSLVPTSRTGGVLVGAGYGLGSRTLPGMANLCRLLETSPGAEQAGVVTSLAFVVDDQSPEDLALALELLRETEGVIEVDHWPVFAKKGRVGARIELLCRPEYELNVGDAIFLQTTTAGFRVARVARRTLSRQHLSVEIDGASVQSTAVYLPDGRARVKPESRAVAARAGDQQDRESLRASVAVALSRAARGSDQ